MTMLMRKWTVVKDNEKDKGMRPCFNSVQRVSPIFGVSSCFQSLSFCSRHTKNTTKNETHCRANTKPTVTGRTYTSTPMEALLQTVLHLLSLPEYGLTTVFVVSFISATLLPLGSEPAVLGLIQLNPAEYWPVIFVATAGNTLGGAVDWWIGYGASKVARKDKPASANGRALAWLERLGPKACLLGWLPLVGDPLCTLAGWLKLPFWPCLGYILIGKFLRYVVMTGAFFSGLQLLN